jgi:phosphoglucomutase
MERFERDTARHDLETQAALAELSALSRSIAGIARYTGRTEPTVIT